MSVLLEIPGNINEAIGLIDDVIQACVASEPADPKYQWPAMSELIDSLERIKKELKNVIPPQVQQAIDSEEKWEAEMEDRADALNY